MKAARLIVVVLSPALRYKKNYIYFFNLSDAALIEILKAKKIERGFLFTG